MSQIKSVGIGEGDESASSSMPLPQSSPVCVAKPSHYASPVKFETKYEPASTPTSSGKPDKDRRHKKKQHHSSGKKRSGTPLSLKEQIVQLIAILLTAAVVYNVTLTAIGWFEEARRPFCDDQQDPLRDNCRPCPENGICRGGELRCIPGFRRQGALCVPDKQIDRNAQNLADFVLNKVCKISGDSLCRNEDISWIPEHQIWDASEEEKMGLDAENVLLVHEKALQLVRDKLNIRIDDFGFELPPLRLQ